MPDTNKSTKTPGLTLPARPARVSVAFLPFNLVLKMLSLLRPLLLSGAGPLWPRFAELNTNRPIFGDRDGELYYDVHQVSFERRQGYAWYTERPAPTLERYQRWRAAFNDAAK
ncbi:MAG: hypothetical protein B7X50_02320 [Alishewanella sp. 34-51-39]|nr:MAG: hypothetical protein B7X50_02320 [Alishewanella sp. 34-51-39]